MRDAFVARGRAVAESLMEDSCVISRDPGFLTDSTFNAATGELTPASTPPAVAGRVEVYAGKCTVAPVARQDDEDNEGGAAVVRRSYEARVPFDAPRVAIGDLLTVTEATHDPELTSRTFVVDGVAVGTFVYYRPLTLDLAVRADAQ